MIKITSHQGEVVVDLGTRPKDEECGLTNGTHCASCGLTITEQEVIPCLREMDVLYLPSSINCIEEEAFSNLPCQAIIIPSGCKSIGKKAFYGCTNLIYVMIPSNVINCSVDAFDNCKDNVFIDWQITK